MWTGNGQTTHKNRALSHDQQQPAQETSLLSAGTCPGRQWLGVRPAGSLMAILRMQQEKLPQCKACTLQLEGSLCSLQLEKSLQSNKDPAQLKIKRNKKIKLYIKQKFLCIPTRYRLLGSQMEIRDLGQKQEIESQNTSNTFRQLVMGPRSKRKIWWFAKLLWSKTTQTLS